MTRLLQRHQPEQARRGAVLPGNEQLHVRVAHGPVRAVPHAPEGHHAAIRQRHRAQPAPGEHLGPRASPAAPRPGRRAPRRRRNRASSTWPGESCPPTYSSRSGPPNGTSAASRRGSRRPRALAHRDEGAALEGEEQHLRPQRRPVRAAHHGDAPAVLHRHQPPCPPGAPACSRRTPGPWRGHTPRPRPPPRRPPPLRRRAAPARPSPPPPRGWLRATFSSTSVDVPWTTSSTRALRTGNAPSTDSTSPPASSTLPPGSRVAVWNARGVPSAGTCSTVPVTGSKISAEATVASTAARAGLEAPGQQHPAVLQQRRGVRRARLGERHARALWRRPAARYASTRRTATETAGRARPAAPARRRAASGPGPPRGLPSGADPCSRAPPARAPSRAGRPALRRALVHRDIALHGLHALAGDAEAQVADALQRRGAARRSG